MTKRDGSDFYFLYFTHCIIKILVESCRGGWEGVTRVEEVGGGGGGGMKELHGSTNL